MFRMRHTACALVVLAVTGAACSTPPTTPTDTGPLSTTSVITDTLPVLVPVVSYSLIATVVGTEQVLTTIPLVIP